MSTISLEIGRWVNDTRPDVINIMLGNEDLNHAFPGVSYVLTYYGSIIKSARKANPKIKIVVSEKTPMFDFEDAGNPRATRTDILLAILVGKNYTQSDRNLHVWKFERGGAWLGRGADDDTVAHYYCRLLQRFHQRHVC